MLLSGFSGWVSWLGEAKSIFSSGLGCELTSLPGQGCRTGSKIGQAYYLESQIRHNRALISLAK